jgi:hypothetical protein
LLIVLSSLASFFASFLASFFASGTLSFGLDVGSDQTLAGSAFETVGLPVSTFSVWIQYAGALAAGFARKND